ncbi:hypothetical protein [Lonepinella sp. BR2930]|uniref:hypothetical protein n=1 Tax=Lonepinella sp. BR2930 TaxID=3434554 RepID=UPI003F6DE3EE
MDGRKKVLNRENVPIGKSGFRGVYMMGGNWYVNLRFKGKRYSYGHSFSSTIEAAQAYDELALKIKGEKAMTNKKLGLFPNAFHKSNRKLVLSEIRRITGLTGKYEHLLQLFCEFLLERKGQKCTFLNFENYLTRNTRNISPEDVTAIFNALIKHDLLDVEPASKHLAVKLWRVRLNISDEIIQVINKDKQEQPMTKQNLTELTPEALEELAKQAAELAKSKKQEAEEKHNLRTVIHPLLLNILQAKGRFEIKLNELLDLSTELDNAIKAIEDAMK